MQKYPLQEIGKLLNTPCFDTRIVQNYHIDSRHVTPHSLFFALPGEKTDGHKFLKEVKEKGAISAIVSHQYSGDDFGLTLIRVDDVQKALQEIAKKDLEKEALTIIGITGSVGKTSTKDFTAHLLEKNFNISKTPSNYNTKLTLPLSILYREDNRDVLVLEMGMDMPGDIGKLIQIAPPEIAILTKVALAHAANFPGGIEEIGKNKGEIFNSSKLKYAICPFGYNYRGEKITFSIDDERADYFGKQVGSEWHLFEWGKKVSVTSFPFLGKHFFYNFLAASIAARCLNISWENIFTSIPTLPLPKMRCEQWEKEGIIFINDAYNANSESMKAAFLSMPEPKRRGRKIGVLGEMTPLGSFSKECHQDVGLSAADVFDHLFVIGNEALEIVYSFEKTNKPVEFFSDIETLAKRVKETIQKDDVVLVKGSRSVGLERIFKWL